LSVLIEDLDLIAVETHGLPRVATHATSLQYGLLLSFACPSFTISTRFSFQDDAKPAEGLSGIWWVYLLRYEIYPTSTT
jgi:hypothetical protein